MTCPNHCRDSEPKLLGKSTGGHEIYFCPVCKKFLRPVDGVLVVSPVCRGVEKVEPKRKQSRGRKR